MVRVLALLTVLLVPTLQARADEAEVLRVRFLSGDEALRASVLKGLEGYPAQVGAVLGPVFGDRTVRAPAAHAAAWLADRAPKDREPLLVDEVFTRADGDPAFVEEVRRFTRPSATAWPALAAAARKRLLDAASPVKVRTGAAVLLRHDATAATARLLADAWETGSEDVRAAAGDGLAAMLAFRFASPAEAKAFFARYERASFTEWVATLSAAKDAPDAPLYRRMVQEARANIERATTLADLDRYLRREQTPWPEVRRLAGRRAPKVQAQDGEWLLLLRRAISEETDRETLVGLLEATALLTKGNVDATRGLADAALARLPSCCADPELLKALLAVLERVGDKEHVAEAYARIRDVSDPGVLETWLSVAGSVGGNEVALCEFHRARADRTDEASIALLVRALDALARGGTESWSGSAVASAYLRGILRRQEARQGEAGLPHEPAPEARMAAVRGLEGFPSPETVSRLRELAHVPPEDTAVARLAVTVLGRMAPKVPEAAEALVDVAQSGEVPEVRIEAVRDLARLAAEAKDDVRRAAIEAVRSALKPTGGSRELRLAAAEAAAALADDGALPGVLALAAEAAKPGEPTLPEPLGASVEGLVTALAKSGAANDPAIADGLTRLAAAGAFDPAIELADAAADAAGGRIALQALRASLRRDRAHAAGRDVAARRKDVSDAHRILRSLLVAQNGGPPPESPRELEAWHGALVLLQDMSATLLDDAATPGDARRAALLAGVEAVVLRRDSGAASRAAGWLAQARSLPDLTPAERTQLDTWDGELTKLLVGPAPVPR